MVVYCFRAWFPGSHNLRGEPDDVLYAYVRSDRSRSYAHAVRGHEAVDRSRRQGAHDGSGVSDLRDGHAGRSARRRDDRQARLGRHYRRNRGLCHLHDVRTTFPSSSGRSRRDQ